MRRVLQRRLRAVGGLIAVTVPLGILVGLVLSLVDEQPPGPIMAGSAMAGLLLGGLVGLCEEFLVPRWTRLHSFRRLTLSRIAFHTTSLISVLVLVNAVRLVVDQGLTPAQAVVRFLAETGLRDFFIVLSVMLAVMLVFQLRRLHTAREIWHLVSGRYHYPVQEERAVLFVDVAGSTGLAERLGSLQYSRFIRDVFADLSEATLAWGGAVYQYVGDGLIVTWARGRERPNGPWLRCFRDMSDALSDRAGYYRAEYDAVPSIRGGVHVGTVVATRVGETRSELALHGDTLNVAARLQSLCASRQAALLASADAVAGIEEPSELGLIALGDVQIRGRDRPLTVFCTQSLPNAETRPAPLP